MNANKKKPAQNIYLMQTVHTITSGGSFGELALENRKPRAARVVTVTDCHFATVCKEDFDKCL